VLPYCLSSFYEQAKDYQSLQVMEATCEQIIMLESLETERKLEVKTFKQLILQIYAFGRMLV